MKIGYTTGVFDILHTGHINTLRNAKALCDKLIVGVTVDELVAYKGTKTAMLFEQRIEIVKSIRYVDMAIPQRDIDKFEAWKRLKFNALFVGDDWYNTDKWNEYEKKFKEVGVEVVYFPYTKGVSSTELKEILRNNLL